MISTEERNRLSFDSIRDLQLYLLPIMEDIDNFCRQNQIKYSLCGGSLLGSIRHKGFIPWDDDLDLMFDRENYEKFIQIAKKSLPDKYEIVGDTWIKRIKRKDNPNDEFQEGFVDLFVMDTIPDNRIVSMFKNIILKTLQGMLKARFEPEKYSLINKIEIKATHALGKLFSVKSKQKMYESVSKWGNKNSKRVNIYNSMFNQIGKFSYTANIMDSIIDVQFENITVCGISDFNQYLTVAYGDYMKLPPENERVPIHMSL